VTEALLLWGDTERSAHLFHALPLTIIDPVLFVEMDGRRIAVQGPIEKPRILELDPGIEVVDAEEYGRDALIVGGMAYDDADIEVAVRVALDLGVTRALVPRDFWAAVADRLRAAGIAVVVDAERFEARRRVKTPRELAGIRRAQAAADAAMAAAAGLLRTLPEDLDCATVRRAMQEVCDAMGSDLGQDAIVALGEQSASGHEAGHGPVRRGDHVVIDIWPRDRESRCFADMTRTFVAGGEDPGEELAGYWRLCREALEAATAAVRPGAAGRDVYGVAAAIFEAAGHPTQRTKREGEVLDSGFFHSLGHGVGLEVHELPILGRSDDVLVAGDVVTLEPGCYRPGFGGCRLEDMLLVTDDGAEVITDFPYDLAP